MAYYYELGAVRWKKHDYKADVRSYRPPKGWVAMADLLEYHPVTGRHLKSCKWWIREEYVGETK